MFREGYDGLENELRRLVEAAGAKNAFVFDAWGVIWASASMTFNLEQKTLYAQVVEVINRLEVPLNRGGKLNQTFQDFEPVAYCRSFGAVYVLCVWVHADTNDFLFRRAVASALPRIETLTLALPPPDGSDPSAGAQHGGA